MDAADHNDRGFWAWVVFARSNTEIVGLNPTQGMDVCIVCVYAVFVLLCVQVVALRRANPRCKESYRLCVGLRNWKSDQGPTKRCRIIDKWMNEWNIMDASTDWTEKAYSYGKNKKCSEDFLRRAINLKVSRQSLKWLERDQDSVFDMRILFPDLRRVNFLSSGIWVSKFRFNLCKNINDKINNRVTTFYGQKLYCWKSCQL
jgi:hypothetical protein